MHLNEALLMSAHNLFSWRNKENICKGLKKVPFLELWGLGRLIRVFAGSLWATKDPRLFHANDEEKSGPSCSKHR